MQYTVFAALLDRYGWESDGYTTERERLQYALTPVRGRRSVSKRGSWHESQGGNVRWRLPGTPLCCSISSTNMAHIYTIACTPPLPPQFLYRIESDDLARVEEVLRFLHRKEAVPVLSAQVWEEIMAAIATRAKDTQEALRIVSLLAERDWRSFLEEYHATVAPDEDEDSAR